MLLDSELLPDHGSSPERRRNARRLDDRRLHRREREIEAARRICDALFQHLTPDELVARALRTALDVVEAESGSILLSDPSTKRLVFRHSIGECPVPTGTAIPWHEGIAGKVFQSALPVIIGDATADPEHFRGVDELTSHITHDMIALPLKQWAGNPIGVLEVLNKRKGELDADDLAILTVVSAIAAASIEQAKLFQEAKLAEVARLLGDIGHDIKNLLMPVVCGTGLLEGEVKELLASNTSLTADKAKASFQLCAEVIGMVRTSTHRILDHVKQIADCVKGLSAPPEFAPGAVQRVVESVFETVRWLATEKGITLKTCGLDLLPTIMMDERRLFNAFYNLVNNAIAEVPADGSITVSGEHDPTRQRLCLRVADTGRGMPPEIRDSLFTAQAKSSKAGGTGLGTKIVKDVVGVHGGTISVESTIGVGTTFTILLPAKPIP